MPKRRCGACARRSGRSEETAPRLDPAGRIAPLARTSIGVTMGAPEQLTIDRRAGTSEKVDEAGARRSLRAQIAKLERERSSLIADAFPHIRPLATPAFDVPVSTLGGTGWGTC